MAKNSRVKQVQGLGSAGIGSQKERNSREKGAQS